MSVTPSATFPFIDADLPAPRDGCFDNELYLREQRAEIERRIANSGERLYIEFGGKLVGDHHAARVLPGFDPDAKLRLLASFADQAEVIICIAACDCERGKIRADYGTTYDAEVARIQGLFEAAGLRIAAIVVTRYENQPAADAFVRATRLRAPHISVYTHRAIPNYPDVATVCSDTGYGANDYVPCERRIVVVTAPGPASGKLGTCLSQLYHESRLGRTAAYAKYESFPIWSLSVDHPVNRAYEAATADLADENVIDPFHLEATGEIATNYNRDVDAFPILREIWKRIGLPHAPRSPTEMGVNRIGAAITDDEGVRAASIQEILRRVADLEVGRLRGASTEPARRCREVMVAVGATAEDRPVVAAAEAALEDALRRGKVGRGGRAAAASLQLPNGLIVTATQSKLLSASAAALLSALKAVAGLPRSMHLLAPDTLCALARFDGGKELDAYQALTAVALATTMNPAAAAALAAAPKLAGCDMHLTHVPEPTAPAALRRLGLRWTSSPVFLP